MVSRVFQRVSPLFRAALCTALLLLTLAGVVRAQSTAPAAGDLAALAETLKLVIEQPAAPFAVQLKHGIIEGKAASAPDLQAYRGLFMSEFALYPPELIKRAELARVILCSELAFGGQRRNAVPDFPNHALYLDVSRGSSNRTYLRKVIHHDFFHIIDYRDDKSLYKDDAWATLNPAGFTYGTGGRNAQDLATTSVLTSQYPGFLNHYSTTGVEEDKAEIYANLIVEPIAVQKAVRKDPVLASKVQQMKALLVQFCPEMDDRFWRKVEKPGRKGQ